MSGVYFGRPWPFSAGEVFIHYVPGLRDLLSSRGIDGIIWTLEVEVKFYLICAVICVLIRRASLWVFLVPILLAAVAMVLVNFPPTAEVYDPVLSSALKALPRSFAYIVYMFCGVTFHFIYIGRLKAVAGFCLIVVLFAVFYSLRGAVSEQEAEVFPCYGLGLVLFSLAFIFRGIFRKTVVTDFLADVSYPLYVVHSVAGYVLMRIMLDVGSSRELAVVAGVVAAFSCAWAIHVAIEKPSQALGKRVGRLVDRTKGKGGLAASPDAPEAISP